LVINIKSIHDARSEKCTTNNTFITNSQFSYAKSEDMGLSFKEILLSYLYPNSRSHCSWNVQHFIVFNM